MKIFILEDDPNRVDQFFKKLSFGHNLTVVDNVREAKAILSKTPFDIFLLDHDLGGRVYVDSKEENTGYQLARWIVEQNISPKQIYIHSMNPTGAQNMLHELQKLKDVEVQHVPFGLFITQIG